MKTLTNIFIACTLFACTKPNTKTIHEQFSEAYYNKGYNSFVDLLANTIMIKDGDYEMKYSKADFKTYYEWDSVFLPKVKITEESFTN